MTSEKLVSERIVRSYELDSFGHVNNAVYLQYCEGARNDYMLQRGIHFSDFQSWNIGPVLYRANIDFKRPAHTDNLLRIEGTITFNGKTRFTINHQMIRANDDQLICLATLEFAFVNLTTQKPSRAPEGFAKAFNP